MKSPSNKNRLQNLDTMRGLAALMVCFYHFGRGLPDGLLKDACNFGNLGVDVFFVISGFVIPLWLDRTGGDLKKIPAFLIKRLVRLYPAYFAACVMILAFWWISSLIPGFRGEALRIDATTTMANIFFYLRYRQKALVYPGLLVISNRVAILHISAFCLSPA